MNGQNFDVPIEYFVNKSFQNEVSSDFIGSPYLTDSFLPATVFFKGSKFSVNIKLNVFKQIFEVQQSSGNNILNFQEGMLIELDGQQFVPLLIDGKITPSILLYSGAHSLFKFYHATFTPERSAKSSYDKQRPASYTIAPYYAITMNDKLHTFSLSYKNVLQTFQDYPHILDFIKKNKLKFRKESELILFIQNIN